MGKSADKKIAKRRHRDSNPDKRDSIPDKALTNVGLKHLDDGMHCDGNGLYLQVSGNARSWIVRTAIHGKRCAIGIGSLKYISLAQARDKAIELRRAARTGGDPLTAKREARRAALRAKELPSFKQAAIQVHAEHSKTFRNPKHAAQWLWSLEKYAFDTIGAKRVDTIESDDVLAVLSPIWTAKPETASRVKQRMRVVFDWAIAKRYRTANPLTAITKVLPKNNAPDKHFAALAYGDVPAFIHQLRATDGAAVSGRLAFEFLILTAARTSEVLNATWKEIDFTAKTWTIPADRMKAKKTHRVPLSVRSVEILEAAKKLSDGVGYIFPGQSKGLPLSNMVFHATLSRMERTGLTPHGFRSSFRDWAQEKTNAAHRTIESALAHVVANKVEAAYLRTDSFEKRRELMAAWERFATAQTIAQVVAFKS